MLPLGASVAGATRVGAALGAGEASQASRAAATCVALGVGYGTAAATALLLLRERVGLAFSADERVINELGILLPVLMLYVIADASQVDPRRALSASATARASSVCIRSSPAHQ